MTIAIRGAAAPTSQGADIQGFDADDLDAAVAAVAVRADAWAATSPASSPAIASSCSPPPTP